MVPVRGVYIYMIAYNRVNVWLLLCCWISQRLVSWLLVCGSLFFFFFSCEWVCAWNEFFINGDRNILVERWKCGWIASDWFLGGVVCFACSWHAGRLSGWTGGTGWTAFFYDSRIMV